MKRKSEPGPNDVEIIVPRKKRPTTLTRNQIRSDASINRPNSLTREAFQEQYVSPTWLVYEPPLRLGRNHSEGDRLHLNLAFKRSADMTDNETQACLDLVRETSRDDYKKSKTMGGWSDTRKRKELTDRDMRFLLLSQRHQGYCCEQSPTALEIKSTSKSTPNAAHCQCDYGGFLSFMLDHDSSPRVPVLYIYEIHLKERLRGHGVGLHILKVAEHIARNVGVDKLMLTCLSSNVNARGFYEKFGFELDTTSPIEKPMRGRTPKVDHIIMCKDLNKSVNDTD